MEEEGGGGGGIMCKAEQWEALQRMASLAYAWWRLQWLGINLNVQ